MSISLLKNTSQTSPLFDFECNFEPIWSKIQIYSICLGVTAITTTLGHGPHTQASKKKVRETNKT